MSSDTVRALAAVGRALSDLASALQREAAAAPEPAKAMTLREAERRYGLDSSTLSKAIGRDLEAARVGRGRGRYYVTPQAVEAYLARRTTKARPLPLVREAV